MMCPCFVRVGCDRYDGGHCKGRARLVHRNRSGEAVPNFLRRAAVLPISGRSRPSTGRHAPNGGAPMAQPTDWKRTLSLALGAAGVVHGLRRGGITGLLEVAASVWALKQSLPGLQLDSLASPARDIPAERLPDADLGVPGGAYNV